MKPLSMMLLVVPWLAVAGAQAGEDSDKTMSVTMHTVNEDGTGESIGEVQVKETDHGVVFEPDLENLSPGLHGFHVHTNPSCQPSKATPAGAAGGHYDPGDADSHGTPWGDGHLGDLPALYVDEEGNATHPVLAPRLEIQDLRGRSLMIHAGGDNYSDHPKPSGGGGARVACGVFSGGSS